VWGKGIYRTGSLKIHSEVATGTTGHRLDHAQPVNKKLRDHRFTDTRWYGRRNTIPMKKRKRVLPKVKGEKPRSTKQK